VARKRLLIIKIDAIGDYILFRNFIGILKKSETFADYRLDLLGNNLWQDIALEYDSQYVSEFFFTKPDDLYEAPLKTLKLGWQLYKNNYEIVLQPSFARTFIADGLAAFTAAKQIIGFEGDTERINIKYKLRTDKFYTQKLQLPVNTTFEFERSKFFFEDLLKRTITIDAPFIEIEKSAGPKRMIIIFLGAGVSERSWEIEKFRDLIKLVLQHTTHAVYLAGGPADLKAGDYLTKSLPVNSVNNLIGKTSLKQLIELISNAALVIANETSAIHIAAATQTKAVCILGGGHFGRFTPYPQHMKSSPLCIFEKIECYYCNWNCKFKTNNNTPFPCISNLSVEKVWLGALELL